jgi:hypothetical protein
MPEAEWLDDGETLSYLHSCVSTRRQRVRVLAQALPGIAMLPAVTEFQHRLVEDMRFEDHAGLPSSKRSRDSISFARGSVRVHEDSYTACES